MSKELETGMAIERRLQAIENSTTKAADDIKSLYKIVELMRPLIMKQIDLHEFSNQSDS